MRSISLIAFASAFAATLVVSAAAHGKQVYFSQLQAEFSPAPLTQKCTLCHSGGGLRLGAFGQDFVKLKTQFGGTNMKQVLTELRKLDSDKDGVSNEEEIHNGKHPGLADK